MGNVKIKTKAKGLLFIYRACATILSPLLIPAAAGIMTCRRKHRRQLPLKLGMVPEMPELHKQRPIIWLHALSAGEVNAASPLLEAMRARWPHAGLVCSASTSSGLSLMEKRAESITAAVTSLPLDFPMLTAHVIKSIAPDCFILTETDIWPDFVWRLKSRGIPALLVNGSISSVAAQRLMKFEQMGIEAARLIYGGFHTVSMQSVHDLERLSAIADFDNLISCGNLKYDISLPDVSKEWKDRRRKELHLLPDDFIFIAGSTHPGEESILAKCLRELCHRHNARLKLIIAPREPSRAREVEQLFKKEGFRTGRTSKLNDEAPQVIIIDTLGELTAFYSLANAAFVGGSLVPTGGHNLFEPALHNIPVLFGPYIESCRDMADLLVNYGGGAMIKSADELDFFWDRLYKSPSLCTQMGTSAAECVNHHRGAVARYIELIENALTNKKTPS